MPSIDKTNKRLRKALGGRATAREERGCLVLEGEVASWDEVVLAGRLAADRKRWRGVVNNLRVAGAAVPLMRTPTLRDNALEGQTPDVLVIGAGVTGCAIARELARHKLNILLVDKEHDVALHASSRNDGMVHPGIDLRKGSEKHRYNKAGNEMYDGICRELGVKFRRHGQYLCFSARMRPLLYLTLPYWKWLGIPGVTVVGKKQLHKAEPGLAPTLACALFFPTAGSVCPYGLTIAYAENAVQNGAALSLETAVLGMETKGGRIESVYTNRGTLRPKVVINAAGVFADEIAEIAGDRFYTIHPRRGTNSILDKKYTAGLVRTIASSIGTTSTTTTHSKGGGIVRTVEKNLLVGPDAVETFEKENFATLREGVQATFEKQAKTAPGLSADKAITYFTGVRAPTYEEDFVITRGIFTRNLVHAAGIQSPGLTAAPAIGVAVARMAVEILEETAPVAPNEAFNPVRPPIVKAAALKAEARAALIAQDADYGEILCRCEEVSRGEILAALRRPVPCDTVDGVKRRVRPGMGRCQGGFCGPLVAGIIAQEKGIPLAHVLKSGEGSELLAGPTKAVYGLEGGEGA